MHVREKDMEIRSKYESVLILDKIEIVESTFEKRMFLLMGWNWAFK